MTQADIEVGESRYKKANERDEKANILNRRRSKPIERAIEKLQNLADQIQHKWEGFQILSNQEPQEKILSGAFLECARIIVHHPMKEKTQLIELLTVMNGDKSGIIDQLKGVWIAVKKFATSTQVHRQLSRSAKNIRNSVASQHGNFFENHKTNLKGNLESGLLLVRNIPIVQRNISVVNQ